MASTAQGLPRDDDHDDADVFRPPFKFEENRVITPVLPPHHGAQSTKEKEKGVLGFVSGMSSRITTKGRRKSDVAMETEMESTNGMHKRASVGSFASVSDPLYENKQKSQLQAKQQHATAFP